MNKMFWQREWQAFLMLVVTAGLMAWTWNRIPHLVPVHWNIHGEVDRYGGRFEALTVLPLIALGVTVFTLAVERLGQARNATAMRVIRLATALLALCFTAQHALGWEPLRAVLVGVGLQLTLMGNIMGKVQPSWWMGFRTPWTYLSKRAWYKSQRRSGLFLVAFGILSILLGLGVPTAWMIPWVMPLGFLVGLGVVFGWLVFCSYIDYRHDPQPERVVL